ncbi:MAG: hypothetical protein ACXVZJ_05780 [Terriglobales bacterium]
MNSNLYKKADLHYIALGCLLLGWIMRRSRQQELDPVMRLRLAGAL